MAVTSEGTKTIKLSKGERDKLDWLDSILTGVTFSGADYYPTILRNFEASDLRDAQRRVQQIVRRYDKAKS